MKYEVVEMKEKIVVGVSAVTGNAEPDMGAVIGKLWQDFYQGGVCERVENRCNAYAIGLYSDYVGEKYCVTVGAQVTEVKNEDLSVKVIPAGKYARFSIHGDMVTAVGEAWREIWKLDLDRSFAGDYEEYKTCDGKNADIDIYIALRG